MHRLSLVVPLFALVASAPARGVDPGFGWFAGLAGACWTGTFPDGKTEHTQCYMAQFGKFLRGTAALKALKDGQWQTAFEGDSVYAWDASRKAIVYYLWGSDGSHRQLDASYAGDELVFAVPSRADPRTIAYRSVWRRIDADTFEVRRERPNDGAWTTELTVVYRRSGAAR